MKAILLVLALSIGLAACGKKPGTLRPDEEQKQTVYPRQYPTR